MANVLVVEDDPTTREAMVQSLAGAGYRVRAASNGAEALSALQGSGGPACLVLLDIVMPVMDGYQVLQRLKSDRVLSAIPVLAVTGTAYDSRLAGCSGFVRKPVRAGELLDRVRQWCRPDGPDG